MDITPLVSVIIATYNRDDLIGETIESILAQTYTNFELIIVDDGSTDNTEEIVKNFKDKRISYIKTDNWGGPARPRNIGIKKARGKYIAFCDDDDYWHLKKLEIQLEHFDENVIGVGSNKIIIGSSKYHRIQKKSNNKLLDMNDLFTDCTLPLSSLIIKNIGILFNESFEFKYVEDFEYQARLVINTGKKLLLLSKPLIYYRTHAWNGSANNFKRKNAITVINIFKNYLSKYNYKKALNRNYFSFGINALRYNSNEASKLFLKSLYSSTMTDFTKPLIGFIISILPYFFRNMILKIYYRLINYIILKFYIKNNFK